MQHVQMNLKVLGGRELAGLGCGHLLTGLASEHQGSLQQWSLQVQDTVQDSDASSTCYSSHSLLQSSVHPCAGRRHLPRLP